MFLVAVGAALHGQAYLGIELSQEYIDLARKRLEMLQPSMWTGFVSSFLRCCCYLFAAFSRETGRKVCVLAGSPPARGAILSRHRSPSPHASDGA